MLLPDVCYADRRHISGHSDVSDLQSTYPGHSEGRTTYAELWPSVHHGDQYWTCFKLPLTLGLLSNREASSVERPVQEVTKVA